MRTKSEIIVGNAKEVSEIINELFDLKTIKMRSIQYGGFLKELGDKTWIFNVLVVYESMS